MMDSTEEIEEREMTFAEEIEEKVGDETIIAAKIGIARGDSWLYDKTDHNLGPNANDWELVRPVLDYEYDSGHGSSQDCHDIWVWTETKVYSIHEYDGSTCIISVDRNPSGQAQ